MAARQRQRASVRRRGKSFQVRVYAGADPLTGKDRYLTESTTSEREVDKIKTRLLATVDQQRSTSTNASLGYVLDAWLDVHDAEQSTIDGYRWLGKSSSSQPSATSLSPRSTRSSSSGSMPS